MASAERLATYEDLLALPEGVRAEVLAGEVVSAPSPLPKHNRIARVLGSVIGGPFDDDDGRGGPGGWWIAHRSRRFPTEAFWLRSPDTSQLFGPLKQVSFIAILGT